MSKKTGKFIVIEGTDGSGKATQLGLLVKRLKKEGFSLKILDFPRYYETAWGEFIGRYQMGEFGEPAKVNPYLSFLPYMLDQFMASSQIGNWVKEGKIILANRYFTSNFTHQAGKLPAQKRKKFRKFLKRAGYKELGIYRPDLVLALYLPHKIAMQLTARKTQRKYTRGRKKDLVERDRRYQQESVKELLATCKEEKNWALIKCFDRENNLMTPEQIHQIIYQALRRRKII